MAKGDNKVASQGYRDIASTGGVSSQDQQNLRARAFSPIKAAYSNAMMNINRQKGLQGGYSPNYGALQAKLARDQSQSMSDASNNINTDLSQMILGNKMKGLEGLNVTAQHKGPLGQIAEIGSMAAGGIGALMKH